MANTKLDLNLDLRNLSDRNASDAATADRGRVPIESLIQGEIERRLRKKSWNQLDVCFKWRLVSAFLVESGYRDVPGIESQLRGMIKRNELTGDIVAYDNMTTRIVGMDMAMLDSADPISVLSTPRVSASRSRPQ
jgi:hypothetical protein